MAAFFARSGVIADLVSGHSCCRSHFLRQSVEFGSFIIVERCKNPAPHIGLKPRGWFNGQLVKREMRRAQCKRARQLPFPLVRRLIGQGIDQIEADPRKMALCHVQCRQCLVRTVKPSEPFQRLVLKRLHAKGNAIDASASKPGKIGRLNRGWIGLKRDFNVGIKAPKQLRFTNQTLHECRRHQRRRTPAKED